MLDKESFHAEETSDKDLFALYRAWLTRQEIKPGLSHRENQRIDGLIHWKSKIVNTARLIRQPDRELLTRLKKKHTVLEPAALRPFIPSYNKYYPDQNNRLYLKNNRKPPPVPRIAVEILGLSGAGKDTALQKTMAMNPGLIAMITTGTARGSRGPDDMYTQSTNAALLKQRDKNELIEGVIQGKYVYATPITAFIRAYLRDEPIIAWRGDIVGGQRFKSYCTNWGIPVVGIGIYPAITMEELEGRLGEKGRTDPWRLIKPGLELRMMPKHLDALITNWPAHTLGISQEEAENQTAQTLSNFLLSLIERPDVAALEDSYFGHPPVSSFVA